ncbi:benzoylformate decarboxylase [Rubrobacter indicoceani]|uniref:benzoylformate decarboxylase n=1 Tax=Rubrobacter indicoceani TaxID=2051957 RepID=UPI000E5A88BB|nr:benzoylformate decarboxylase [Rubrobacter indicoceani]
MPTVRDATLDLLRELGMTTVFGNPGSTELPMLRDWPPDFRYILALHEAAALGMAEGYARQTGNAAFVNLHTAPGLGNAMGQMVTAWHNRTPLVVTAGQQHRDHIAREPMLKGELTELAKPYVKRSHEPRRAGDVPHEILRAYHTAMTAPQGPVFLSIPMDDWDAQAEPVEVTSVSYRRAPDPDGLAAASEVLAAAQNPAIVVGPGVARSVGPKGSAGGFGSVVALAEKLRAPVFQEGVVALSGFPQRHPLFQGFLPLAQKPLAAKLAPYDAVLVVGTRVFSYYPYVPGPVVEGETSVVLITDDPEEAAFSPTGRSIIGDVELSCGGLLGLLPESDRTPPVPVKTPGKPEPSDPMSVAFVMDAVSRTLPEDAVVADESTSSKGMLHRFVKPDSPDAYLSSEAGGLGFCLPASVGAKLAMPDRTVACIIGDGSSMYSIQALWTAASYGVGVVFVIINNRGYSILKSFRDVLGLEGVPGLDVPGLDHVQIARGFGVEGEAVRSPGDLEAALVRAVESGRNGRPYLVNAVVSGDVPPLL